MANVVRVPITNIYMGGDYTCRVLVGPTGTPLNVILDTGSSALALDGHKYQPQLSSGDQVTNLAQADSYGEGSGWAGAVITTTVAIGDSASHVDVAGVNAAVTYEQTANMFRGADGILGLAYAPLDGAYQLPEPTWPKRYSMAQVMGGTPMDILPFFAQLSDEGVAADKFSLYTKRSFTRASNNPAADPQNQGYLIIGGGEESKDLYSGPFQNAKVLSDRWYNTNLEAIRVGDADPVYVRARPVFGKPSNSIVDSGTNSLALGPQLLNAVVDRFTPAQRALLLRSITEQWLISGSELNLASWPDLTFVLQGDTADVSLRVSPSDYWQLDSPQPGAAMAAISLGEDGFAILGLPLMNGYFTVFDGSADNGRGAIRFAPSKR